MQASDECATFIKGFESFFAKPYLCPAGVPTIGYGTTYYADGRKVTLRDAMITEAAASALLMHQLNTEYAPGVEHLVQVELTQREFDALTSFAYNIGTTQLRNSTLLKKLNAGDKAGAAEEFLKWVRGGGKVLPGLVRRRKAERLMFLGKSYAAFV